MKWNAVENLLSINRIIKKMKGKRKNKQSNSILTYSKPTYEFPTFRCSQFESTLFMFLTK